VETGKRTPVPLCDRFFSGGNFFLRGFAPFSIGPRSAPFSNENFSGGVAGGDALGGLIKSNALIAVSVPLPIAAAARSGARAFAFCSAGAVDSPHSLRNTSISEIISGSSKIKPIELLSEVARASRLTVGCGSSLSLGPVRLEASYAVPLRRDTGDAMRQFQIGIGISIA
jgi:outer membrane protein assembly factor BamA